MSKQILLTLARHEVDRATGKINADDDDDVVVKVSLRDLLKQSR